MNELTIPKKLDPIVKAFFAESPKAAKKLIIQAAKAIYGAEEEDYFDVVTRSHTITSEDLENICLFMQGIKPIDLLEAILASQIVVSHMLGMRKLSKSNIEDQRLGLKMLQFSNEAMGRLQKKRSGGMQNITVNYNYNGTKPPVIPIFPTSKGELIAN